jgi:hypothetical protein
MSYLIDDLARFMASPMPRRKALGVLGGALGATLLGVFGPRRGSAATSCPRGTTACGTICCKTGTTCCNQVGFHPFCATGAVTCGGTQTCCKTGPSPFCVPRGQTCCGSTSCRSGQTCCNTSSRPFCVTTGRTCCGGASCGRGETCCNNTVCCQPNQSCKNGRCQASGV